MRKIAFTLVEMLVVVVIIVILVGVALPAYMYARKFARTALAKTQIKQLETALTNYQSTYNSTLPFDSYASTNTWDILLNDEQATGDMDVYVAGPPAVKGYAWLLTCLNGQDSGSNPRQMKLLDVKTTSTGTLEYNDPWNHPFRVALDTNYSETVSVTHPKGAGTARVIYNSTVAINGSYVVWSAGADGRDDSTSVTAAVNTDNVLSWQK